MQHAIPSGARQLLVVGGVAILVSFFARGRHEHPGSEDVVRAKRFELLDAAGKVRARLAPGEKGETELAVLDEAGKVRARVGLNAQGESQVSLHDADGKTRIALVVDQGNAAQALLLDPGQKPRLHLAVSRQGAPGILCVHTDGTMPAGFGVHADGRPWSLPASAAQSQPSGR